ncbi:MAG: hypothetical protein Q9219_007542, partial [cf. Caloplaca sp. 3 TL-2023]
MCTIVRIAGIHTGRTVESIDSIWETYWQFIAANIALTMTAATAFRTFFVSRGGGGDHRPAQAPGADSADTFYSQSRKLLSHLLSAILPSRRSKGCPSASSGDGASSGDMPIELRQQIPRATLTGMRTFIGGQGRSEWQRQ